MRKKRRKQKKHVVNKVKNDVVVSNLLHGPVHWPMICCDSRNSVDTQRHAYLWCALSCCSTHWSPLNSRTESFRMRFSEFLASFCFFFSFVTRAKLFSFLIYFYFWFIVVMVTAASNSVVQCVFFTTLKVTLESLWISLTFSRHTHSNARLLFSRFFVTSKSSATVSRRNERQRQVLNLWQRCPQHRRNIPYDWMLWDLMVKYFFKNLN